MVNGKLVSIGEIIWRVLRNPLAQDLSYEQAAEFAIEYIRLIGAPLSFENVTQTLKVIDFKSYLPSDLINIKGVRYTGCDGCDDGIAMRYATDIYHTSNNKENNFSEYTYIVQNCVLITSFKEGFIEISYTAISKDEKGFPLIPDNESYKMGLEYYILDRYLEPLWMIGKISDKAFNYIKQERHWFLGQAENSMKLQGIDQLESMMNALNRIIIQDQSYETFYKNFGQKENIRKYN